MLNLLVILMLLLMQLLLLLLLLLLMVQPRVIHLLTRVLRIHCCRTIGSAAKDIFAVVVRIAISYPTATFLATAAIAATTTTTRNTLWTGS